MHKLTEKNIKKYLKSPHYLTLCRCKHEEKLLRLDLSLKKGSTFFSFNDIKTGKTLASSEDLGTAIGVLEENGYEIMFFDGPTEFYQYIIDFLS